ncbi:MAG TPA: phosphatase PAP2 family protein [Chitinophagales bacterium]|nr:phosphatase PAP2 family protein [Chitinophagales bacterium]
MIETLRHYDRLIFYFINQQCASPVLDFLCPILREKLTWAPLYVIIAFFFFKTYKRNIWVLLAFAGLTILLSDQISSSLIKPYFHRLRPCNSPALMASVRLVIAHCGNGYSFVSSHAANHFAIATFICAFVKNKRLYVPLLMLWAAAVSLSQVYVGVHYPIDVACGALLGIIIGYYTSIGAKKVMERFS